MKLPILVSGLMVGLLMTAHAAAQPPTRPQGQQAQQGQPRTVGGFVTRLRAMDANKDGKISKDELPERMQSILTRVDTNKDDAIDEKELKALEARFAGNAGDRPQGQRPQGDRPQGQRPQRPDGFGAPGGNNPQGQRPPGFDGQGGRPGQGGQGGQAGARTGLPPLPIFMVLDRDRNGEISKEEIANAAKALTQLDRDRNGKLTMEELMPAGFGRGSRPGQGGQGAQGGQGGRPGGQPGQPRGFGGQDGGPGQPGGRPAQPGGRPQRPE